MFLIIGFSNIEDLNIQLLFKKGKNEYEDVLPRIKMNCSCPPNITEIFKSRKLFINDSKLNERIYDLFKKNIIIILGLKNSMKPFQMKLHYLKERNLIYLSWIIEHVN